MFHYPYIMYYIKSVQKCHSKRVFIFKDGRREKRHISLIKTKFFQQFLQGKSIAEKKRKKRLTYWLAYANLYTG